MKLFTTSLTKHFDQYTVEHEPISSIDLMERAAAEVTYAIMARYGRGMRVVVFAGHGNNGGDALAVSRMLLNEGYRVETYLFNPQGKLSTEAEKMRDRLLDIPFVAFTEVVSQFSFPLLDSTTLVIDGLFGAGLRVPLTGGFASIVQNINASEATIVSIDLPSGLFGENNVDNNHRNIIRATLTLSFQYPKLSFFFAENERFTGEWKVLNIGLHPQVIAETPTSYFYTTANDITPWIKNRNRFTEKREMGHALLVAGCYGMMGAAVLAARATLHTGAGLLTIHTPGCGYELLQTAIPEALVNCDSATNEIMSVPLRHPYAAIAIGPGIGQASATQRAFEQLLRQLRRPVVIDADGLNMISTNTSLLSLLPEQSILTPHTREFDRMFGKSFSSYERIDKAVEICKRYNIIIVIKGANSCIVTPRGDIYFNSTGNAGMASAGMGDALTGVLLGLLTQGYTPLESAILGVYLHGVAGDIAAEEECQEYITASDVISRLGKAMKQLKTQTHGNHTTK